MDFAREDFVDIDPDEENDIMHELSDEHFVDNGSHIMDMEHLIQSDILQNDRLQLESANLVPNTQSHHNNSTPHSNSEPVAAHRTYT
jgi:hypothetical protein